MCSHSGVLPYSPRSQSPGQQHRSGRRKAPLRGSQDELDSPDSRVRRHTPFSPLSIAADTSEAADTPSRPHLPLLTSPNFPWPPRSRSPLPPRRISLAHSPDLPCRASPLPPRSHSTSCAPHLHTAAPLLAASSPMTSTSRQRTCCETWRATASSSERASLVFLRGPRGAAGGRDALRSESRRVCVDVGLGGGDGAERATVGAGGLSRVTGAERLDCDGRCVHGVARPQR